METTIEIWRNPVLPGVPPSGGSLEIGNEIILGVLSAHTSSPFGGIPRNWKHENGQLQRACGQVPPSGGSLEIGNFSTSVPARIPSLRSPFGGIPRNWKPQNTEPHQRGSLREGSPFGGIPRNWKPLQQTLRDLGVAFSSPFGGIPRNWKHFFCVDRHYFTSLFPLRGDP